MAPLDNYFIAIMETTDKQKTIDLAAVENGGRVLLASDEFFAAKENLIKSGRGEFSPEKYTDRGKWMDGWETRRKRTLGHDWCIIRLGKPGLISELDIDTNHFVGNYPSAASVEGCHLPFYTSYNDLTEPNIEWIEILPRSTLKGNSQNLFNVDNKDVFSHLRLNIFPDGGVARFRVFGQKEPPAEEMHLIDVTAAENGGSTLTCSDMHFGKMQNIIKSGDAANMSDGWETKRRRGRGHDWVILKQGSTCIIKRVVVDTLHFKGNFPDSCTIEGCFSPNADADSIQMENVEWQEVLSSSKLKGNVENIFHDQLLDIGPCTHIRLNIFPDGGVSRLRIFGQLVT